MYGQTMQPLLRRQEFQWWRFGILSNGALRPLMLFIAIFMASHARGHSPSSYETKKTSPVLAQNRYTSSSEMDNYIRILEHINATSIAEAAVSHGSYGTFVGMGLQRSNMAQPSILIDENLNNSPESPSSSSSFMIPRVYLTKGLPIPVDFTLSAANISTNVNQLAVTTQISLFQSKKWPSLAVRGAYGQLVGIPQTDFSTGSLSLVTSYSLLSYFTFFYETMNTHHWANIRPYEPHTYTYLLLTENDTGNSFSTYEKGRREAIGLQIALYTSPLFFTLQWERDSYQEINQTAKLTVMF